MGENVLQGQVKIFKKGADRSLKTMAAPRLFNRPDVVSTAYTAAPLEGCSAKEGDQFDAHASADGKHVHLAKGHIAIARIEGDGAKLLLDVLREPGSPGIVPMKATNVSELSGFIKAVVVGGSQGE
jgi:hypothetical protein